MPRTYFEKWKIINVSLDDTEENKDENHTYVYFEDNNGTEQAEFFAVSDYQKLKDLEGETVNVECLHVANSNERMFLNFVSSVPKEISLSQIKPTRKEKVEFT